MTFEQMVEILTRSDRDDWSVIVAWGHGSGPSYRTHLDRTDLEDSHHTVAVYKPDLSVTLAWGMTINDNFLEPWANGFPDPRARGNIADVFYNSALVLREHYVVVDGGRAYLPMPDTETLEVARRPADFVRLLSSLTHHPQIFDDYMTRARIRIRG